MTQGDAVLYLSSSEGARNQLTWPRPSIAPQTHRLRHEKCLLAAVPPTTANACLKLLPTCLAIQPKRSPSTLPTCLLRRTDVLKNTWYTLSELPFSYSCRFVLVDVRQLSIFLSTFLVLKNHLLISFGIFLLIFIGILLLIPVSASFSALYYYST